MSKREIVVTLTKQEGNDVVVVKPRKGRFTTPELEHYFFHTGWADEVDSMSEVSGGVPLASETSNEILFVHSGKGSVKSFEEKVIDHLEKIFTVIRS